MASANVLASGSEPSLLLLDPYNVSDFTLYTQKASTEGEKITRLIESGKDTANSYSDPICLQHLGNPAETFRSLICSCFRGKQYSITLRTTGNTRGQQYEEPVARYRTNKDVVSEYDPIQADHKVPASERPKFLFSWQNYNDVLYRTTLLASQDKGGLVLLLVQLPPAKAIWSGVSY